MAIDTLKVAKRLREAGFTEPQAEAVTAAVQEATEEAEFATKADIAEVKAEIREAERFGGIEIDDQLKSGRLLNRQVGRLGAVEDLSGINADLANGSR